MSQIEGLIKSESFDYLQPILYRNQNVLRCELSEVHRGKANRRTAFKNALAIYELLFPAGADALFFHSNVSDMSLCEDYGFSRQEMEGILACEREKLNLLASLQNVKKRTVIENLARYDDAPAEVIKRNRIIFYAGSADLNEKALIKRLTDPREGRLQALEPSFVSFANECILSIYDERGCDIFFADKEKYRQFFHRLQPFLFDYDIELMRQYYAQN